MILSSLKAVFHKLPISFQQKTLRIITMRMIWVRRLKSKLFYFKPVNKYLSDDNLYWIDPKKIVYRSNEFHVYEYHGKVLSGDWDKLNRKFQELDFYQSYEQRVTKGTGWEELPYYKRVLSQIEKGIELWSCKNKDDWENRCQKLDNIFNDIKTNGYRSQLILQNENLGDKALGSFDEITVNIGRNGDLLFNNGRHRLTFAQLIGIERIPIKITVRHKEWELIKNEIELYAKQNGGEVYAPLTHIDLQSIPSHHTDERYQIIRKHIGQENKTLLDIGAHWGYYCHRFEEDRLGCTAVENAEEHLFFLRKLKRAENREFSIISESILSPNQKGPLLYDIILALAVFHHFLKDEDSFQKFKHLLNSLEIKELFFESHQYEDPQMQNAYKNFNPQEFTEFILNNSCLNNSKMIGECQDGRLLYKLWR